MTLGKRRRAIGVFTRERDAQYAYEELKQSGFPIEAVSVIAKQSGDNATGTDLTRKPGHETDKGAAVGAVTGTTLGLLGGLLAGVATFAIPGIGIFIGAGTIATTLATTLAGGGIGAISGGLVGALAGLGIPDDRAKVYSDRLSQGDYLIVVEGTADEILRAQSVLFNNPGLEEWGVYDADSDRPRQVNLEQEVQADLHHPHR
ncbi:DUF1269 domain-containing protein [Almyronema epifaneia]|uniref:DUF1269 domain-containing protein n=1 Tax=Almyronema epifaneia S1 TaxID=2991925 RepID=A0ABW6II09_9CYAN